MHTIHTFWHNSTPDANPDLMTTKCLESIGRLENPSILWTYGEINTSNIELGNMIIKDANEIVPFSEYFTVDYGPIHGYAYFSNFIRYSIFQKYTGWWFDTDVFMYSSPDELIIGDTEIMLFEERVTSSGITKYNGAILYSGNTDHDFWKSCILACHAEFAKKELTGNPSEWGVIGPGLMTKLVDAYCNDSTVSVGSRIPFYANGYMYDDLQKFAYEPMNTSFIYIIDEMIKSKKIIGSHLWFSAIKEELHEDSFYAKLLNT